MQDLMAGQIDPMLSTAADSVEQARAGNIKAYAVTAKTIGNRTRHSECGRGWIARVLLFAMVGAVRVQRHA
jgi:hypothetical protein